MKRKHLFSCLAAMAVFTTAQAQVKVGDNPGTINAGSALEIESTNKGLLMPRVALTSTTTWGLAGTAVAGMSVYNTATGLTSSNTAYPAMGVGEYYWDGTGWVSKKSGAQLGADNGLTVGYNSTGNVGLGGTLNKNTDISTNGKTMSFSGSGSFGLGTTSPQRRLHLVNDNLGDLADDILIQTYSTSATPGLFFSSAGGTPSSPTNIVPSRLLATIGSSGLVGGSETALSSIKFFYEGDGSTNLSSMRFYTNNTDRMTLNASGNLGIGTGSPATRLDINNGTTAGAIKIVDGTQGANKILTSDANGVGTWQSPADIEIPTPAVYSLQSDISNFLNGASAGSNQSVPMAQIANSTGGNVTFNSGTNTISLKPGVYQMTFVYEATHDASGCTVSSYIVDFPPGTGSSSYKRIHSTAAHNQGGTSSHGGTISFTTVITGTGYNWQIRLGRGQSGNCSGTGNTLVAGSTQLTVLRY